MREIKTKYLDFRKDKFLNCRERQKVGLNYSIILFAEPLFKSVI